jgi:hypothetical protein
MLDKDAAFRILQEQGSESVYPGDFSSDSRAHVRRQTLRIEFADLTDIGKKSPVSLI